MPFSRISKPIFLALTVACLVPGVSAAIALLAGIAFALLIGNPYALLTTKWTSRALQVAVVGLGAGMNLNDVLHAGAHGILYTFFGVALTLGLGLTLGSMLKNNRQVS